MNEKYREEYKRKLVTVEEALSHVQDGWVIGAGAAAAEPNDLMQNMHLICDHVNKVKYYCGLGMRPYPFFMEDKYADKFDSDSIFLMAPGRVAHRAGHMHTYCGHLHNGCGRWMDQHPLNVFMIATTPMDDHGYFRMSMCLIHEREMLERADMVIVEIMEDMPYVYGDTEIHISQVDYIVEGHGKLPNIPAVTPNDVEQAIGENISKLVNDGDTIQLGIGGIPDAVAHCLTDKHDLGVHTEMLTNGMVDLVECGAINCSKKTLHNGKMVGVFAMGEQRLYDFIDKNPMIHLVPGRYGNHPGIIAQNDNMVSINTTLNVDLFGQCASETIGSLQYSGSGGQADTAIGALHSKGGKNIIAVKAVAHTKQGDISAIHAQLPAGSVVTLTRNDIDFIVTEYGIAELRGRSVQDRVDRLIAIAHPDYRAELRKEAARLMIW